MLEAGRVTYKQLILLIFISRLIVGLTYLPGITAPPANQDIWLVGIFHLPIELLLSIPIYLLWKRFPDQSIIQYSETLLGIGGKIIGVLYAWLFIQYSAITLTQLGFFMSTMILPDTPPLFIVASMVLVCAYGVLHGLKVLGRLSEIVAPIIIIAIITIFVLIAKDMDLKKLTPFLETGIFPIMQGGFIAAARSMEIIGLAMVFPCLNDQGKGKTVLIAGYTLPVIIFILLEIVLISIFGGEAAKKATFPVFLMIRTISLEGFLERIESVHLAVWLLGIFIKVSFYYYLAVLSIGQLFDFKEYKPLILPVSAIIIPLCIIIAPNLAELRVFTGHKIFTWYVLFFSVVIPSLLLFTAILRKKGVPGK